MRIFLWGVGLWLFGYVLGIVLFPFVPNIYLGWAIMPVGILSTLIVLRKWFEFSQTSEAFTTGLVWMLEAIVFDFIFLVQLFHPADGYYKLDVYLYYLLTLTLPLMATSSKTKKAIWFGSKKWGWGWTPVTWQGWLIVASFIIASIFFASINVLPFTTALVIVLVVICYKTGEKPHWRWGK